MTSSSGIRSTGEKKCMPSIRSGWRAPSAMLAIGMVEVLLAMMVSGRTTSSRSCITRRLTSRSSKTASITMSARSNPLKPQLPDSSAAFRSNSNLVMRRRVSWPRRISVAAKSPLPTRGRSESLSRASTPAWDTAVPAMPAPMKPAPTTPRRRTGRGAAVPGGTPSSFLSALVAKKIRTRLRDTSPTASSPKSSASLRSPASMPCSSPVRTASSAASGAG